MDGAPGAVVDGSGPSPRRRSRLSSPVACCRRIGQRTRYVLADAVLPHHERGDGLADLLHAQLRALGPATAADLTYFTGLTGLAAPLKAVAHVLPGSAPRAPVFDVDGASLPAAPDAVVLAEYENVYFASRSGPLRAARKRLIPNTATRMHGSLLWRGKPVAAWRPDGDRLTLEPWGPLPAPARRAFTRLSGFYTHASQENR